MTHPNRPIAFVLASSNHGTMIVNRNDHHVMNGNYHYGVGYQILQNSCFDPAEIGFARSLLDLRRRHFGDGVFAIDGGANIGVHTVEWARHMHGWGRVLGFEAQEVVYYALAGNLAINNCLNARVRLAALGEQPGTLVVPQPDYFSHASFGSLELRQRDGGENIGQPISYEARDGASVPLASIDSLGLDRVDLIKLDVEGMELEVLRGAMGTLRRFKPMLSVEILKSDAALIRGMLGELGYNDFPAGPNLIAVHRDDPSLAHIQHRNGVTWVNF